jgi:hypothetical protein
MAAKLGGAHPFFYDTTAGRWFRRKVEGKGPVTGFADALVYVPTLKKTLLYQRGNGFWVYDNKNPSWSYVTAKGGRPTTADGKPSREGSLCYDSKRDRLYIFNGGQLSVPWAYECKTNTFTDLKARNQFYPASNSYEQGKLMLSSTSSNVTTTLSPTWSSCGRESRKEAAIRGTFPGRLWAWPFTIRRKTSGPRTSFLYPPTSSSAAPGTASIRRS